MYGNTCGVNNIDSSSGKNISRDLSEKKVNTIESDLSIMNE